MKSKDFYWILFQVVSVLEMVRLGPKITKTLK